MRLLACFIASGFAKNLEKACMSLDEETACYSNCDTALQGCYLACDADNLDCHRDCMRSNADFEEYTCGGWTSSNKVPDDSGSYTQFAVLNKDLLATLNSTLTTDDLVGDSAVKKAQQVYYMCQDEATIDSQSTEQLKYEVFLNWPTQNIIHYPIQGDQSLQFQLVTAWINYGINPIFAGYPDLDPADSSKWLMELGHPSLGMSQSYYLTEVEDDRKKYKDAYVGYIEEFSKYFRDQMETGQSDDAISKMANKIYDFEFQIANMMWNQTEMRDPENSQRKRYLADVATSQVVPDWVSFLKLFSDMGANLTDSVFDPEEMVILMDEKWLNNTDNAIAAAGMEDSDLQDFIAWRVYMSLVPYLGAEWRETSENFNEVLSGATPKPRWESCVNEVNDMMTWATGRLYVDVAFKEESKKTTEVMIAELQNAFATNILADATWMSDETKQEALKKLQQMTVNVGYPDWIKDDEQLDDRYTDLEIQWMNYLASRIAGRKYGVVRLFQLLWSAVDKAAWGTGPALVNAFYAPKLNSITFPAGILQPPFFGKDLTLGMNFGGIGVVIGHEITHGFDDQGSQFDGEGNFKNWWLPMDKSNFDARVQCIKDEYSGFFFEEAGKNLNGDLTAGENTADNGGMWESFYAYGNWRNQDGNADKFLPGLSDKFTENQLYYINYGQIWCSLYKPEYAKWMVDNDPHSPGPFRINGVVQNHGNFGETFGCKKGTPLVPEKTCRVW